MGDDWVPKRVIAFDEPPQEPIKDLTTTTEDKKGVSKKAMQIICFIGFGIICILTLFPICSAIQNKYYLCEHPKREGESDIEQAVEDFWKNQYVSFKPVMRAKRKDSKKKVNNVQDAS